MPNLQLERRNDGLWITGLPDREHPECGPYDKQAQANDDLRGLRRFFRHEYDPIHFLGSDEAKAWRKEKMENLRQLVESSKDLIGDLLDMRMEAHDAGVSLHDPRGLLQNAIVHLTHTDEGHRLVGIKAVKTACEKLADCAMQSQNKEFTVYLTKHVSDYAKIVARFLPLLTKGE